jgi:adenylate kinase
MVRLVLLGAPGAGKGTQAQFIMDALDLSKVATGDMLRAAVKAKTPLGIEAQAIMESGGLVSDDLIIALVKDRLTQPDCEKGCLFDGFPRTIAQAQALIDASIKIDIVLDIDVPDETIIQRLVGRRIHPASGRVYHEQYNPPINAGFDDLTGEPLIQREDDQEATVKKRLKIYHEQTQPLVNFYQNRAQLGDVVFKKIKGDGALDLVKAEIFNFLQPWIEKNS